MKQRQKHEEGMALILVVLAIIVILGAVTVVPAALRLWLARR